MYSKLKFDHSNLEIWSEPHIFVLYVRFYCVLSIFSSVITNISLILKEVFLRVEQNPEVLVSLRLLLRASVLYLNLSLISEENPVLFLQFLTSFPLVSGRFSMRDIKTIVCFGRLLH